MEMACAFTGHRPVRFSFGYDDEDEKCIRLKLMLAAQISRLIESGVSTFYTGMALGTDQWCAGIVLDMKREYPNVRLTAVLPCETQASKWSPEQRERYFNTLADCDDVITLNTRYTPDCMRIRNETMVDRADFLLAIWNGKPRGDTAATVRYAKSRALPIVLIDPFSV